MSQKITNVLARSDRMLVAALAVVLCAGSAAVGAAVVNGPHTDNVVVASVAPAATGAPAPALRPAVVEAPAASKPAVATLVSVPVTAQPVRTALASDPAMAQLLAEHRCLSEVMYYEARGEGQDGQMAVAEVVFHRLRHGHYGHSICAVVYEGAGGSSAGGCQFSFACHTDQLAQHKSAGAWRTAEVLAARILTGQTVLGDSTGDATHFHAISVSPDWALDNGMERTAQIGNHVFYRHRSL
jgi:spore germination cell wall hydrolase CwlJ-like protein